jgi:hypothetical protein
LLPFPTEIVETMELQFFKVFLYSMAHNYCIFDLISSKIDLTFGIFPAFCSAAPSVSTLLILDKQLSKDQSVLFFCNLVGLITFFISLTTGFNKITF